MYVYVLNDKTGKQYVGITVNLERRFRQHKNGNTPTTTKMDLASLEIVHYWCAPDYICASKFERYLHGIHKRLVLDLVLDCPLWNKLITQLVEIKPTLPYEVSQNTKLGY